jgi:hypothetical protein
MMMAGSAGTANGWVISGVLVALYMPFLIWMYLKMRSESRKAKIKRRLLVMEEGQPVWRTVRGALLVGWPGRKQRVHSGPWATSSDGPEWDTGTRWAIIQTAKGKFVVYRFDKKSEPATGVIRIVDSWRELEAAVPPSIFEQALEEAGFRKPEESKEVPLKL